MNPLQAALIGKGLATKQQAPPEPVNRPPFFLGLGAIGDKTLEVRLYWPDGTRTIPYEAVETVRSRVEALGYKVGYGEDDEVMSVESIIPGGFDQRAWIVVKCGDLLTTDNIFHTFCEGRWPANMPLTRITVPGISGRHDDEKSYILRR